jgi:hypothetical protein
MFSNRVHFSRRSQKVPQSAMYNLYDQNHENV